MSRESSKSQGGTRAGENRSVMRILIVNHRFFVSGGPERYLFSITRALESRGHQVVHFSIRYNRNLPSPFSADFAAPPVSADHVYFADSKLDTRQKLSLFGRLLFNRDAYGRLRRVIAREKIDVVYVLQGIHFLYAPAVLAAHRENVPVLCRMSDFQLLCPAYVFFRDDHTCEECRGGRHHAIRYACVQGSRAVSAARVAAMGFQDLLGINHKVSAFVCPSRFMVEKMIAFGFAPEQVHYLPTFSDPTASPVRESGGFAPAGGSAGAPYMLYVGTWYRYKGVHTLVQSFARMPHTVGLKVVGGAGETEARDLARIAAGTGHPGIEFLGFVHGPRLEELYANCLAVVLPSICYDNFPNVILEAMEHAKPVIASNLGSLPELVEDGATGLLFAPGDTNDLARQMQRLLADPDLALALGRAGKKRVDGEFTPDPHLEALLALMETVVRERGAGQSPAPGQR